MTDDRDFWKDGFRAEDFYNGTPFKGNNFKEQLAERANAILKRELEKADQVFLVEHCGYKWLTFHNDGDTKSKGVTHQARLVAIEKIKGEK